ncbi:response regulator [Lederbergia sp. NSJ-179]|uniref:response regulator transcription factor n=1 Tax=Lederbergia sp. NSJ-179 TaxID=2931402 RepID=UPI001FCF9E2A|nr:response regulator [Lederbergia sp. NSJ-179]MCJ7843232.1 response regulator [Lederbergia sp. NSJ-179]
MYKVLLVDDERIILDGISNFIQWETYQTTLIGTAKNGVEAYQIIEEKHPDIVITDIKMPGMNGVELVEKVHEKYPETHFIMISGFAEFDYAKQAMQYGVKHYLLKPCNENSIIQALEECKEEIEKIQTIQEMKQRLEKMLPYAKEQLLKEFVTSDGYGSKELEYYQLIFRMKLRDPLVKLVLFQIEDLFDYEHLFAIKNISEHIFEKMILSCTVGEHVLLVISVSSQTDNLHKQIEQIRERFFQYYQKDTTIAVSEAGRMISLRRLYKQTLECLQHRFYLGEGSIITKDDISTQSTQENDLRYDEQKFCLFVKSGRWEDADKELARFFQQLAQLRLDIQTTKSYCVQLFNGMIRMCHPEQMKEYLLVMPQLLELDTIHSMHTFFSKVAKEITLHFYQQNKSNHSAIIQKVLHIIEEEIGNQELSLHFIANERMFMSPDYLGKLFKKEMGERFSNYMTRVRVEKAIELIDRDKDVKIFEVAEKLGFTDSQYFSQVFKKITGLTPSEYRKV